MYFKMLIIIIHDNTLPLSHSMGKREFAYSTSVGVQKKEKRLVIRSKTDAFLYIKSFLKVPRRHSFLR